MENHFKAYISINGQIVDSAIFFEESSYEKIKRALYNRNKYRVFKKDHIDIWYDKITYVKKTKYEHPRTKRQAKCNNIA